MARAASKLPCRRSPVRTGPRGALLKGRGTVTEAREGETRQTVFSRRTGPALTGESQTEGCTVLIQGPRHSEGPWQGHSPHSSYRHCSWPWEPSRCLQRSLRTLHPGKEREESGALAPWPGLPRCLPQEEPVLFRSLLTWVGASCRF